MVSIFQENIDNLTFPDLDSSNSPVLNTTLTYKYVKDAYKIKNSIKNFSEKFIKKNKPCEKNLKILILQKNSQYWVIKKVLKSIKKSS
ncbi:hypothetical protein [Borreliella turdi]|uniref:hypothetical protein n=1 Tax=Borreliella turdi TaxID=57863 RepID=UPI0012456C64|nr:hypothetical protein [Borreliella turdi]